MGPKEELFFISGGPCCGKCMVAEKNHSELKKELEQMNVDFNSILAEENMDLCSELGVQSVPQYAYFYANTFVGLVDGMSSVSAIKEAIEKFKSSGLAEQKLQERLNK